MKKERKKNKVKYSHEFCGVPTNELVDSFVLKAIETAVKRGEKFAADEDEVHLSPDQILRILVDNVVWLVASEVGLREKVNEKLKTIVENYPYLIEQLGEPCDIENQLDIQDELRGWLGDESCMKDWQHAIMSGNGMCTIPRRPLPNENFERVDYIEGKKGYIRDQG